MSGVDIDVRVPRGGIFSRALTQAEVGRFQSDAVTTVSSVLMSTWHENLDRSIRNPTPYYETQLTRQRVSPSVIRVHDRGVVYGPWLEGTSSRNRTSRFKGYSSLRRARQATIARVPQLVAAARQRLVRGLTP